MLSKRRYLRILVVMVGLLGMRPLPSAAQELPATPVPVSPSNPPAAEPAPVTPLPQPTRGDGPPQLLPPPGPFPPVIAPLPPPPGPGFAPIVPYQDNNGPLLRYDPLIDRPHSPPPGWFAAAELDLVGPQIKNRLQAPVFINDPVVLQPGVREFLGSVVHLPTAGLDWTGAPRFDLGYRFPEGCGEVVLAYRFLVSEGRALLPRFDLGDDGFLKSRLDLHSVDLDYASREYSLDPHWDMKWRAGVRLANVYFDSLAEGFFREERTSDHFFGGGPHVGLDLWRSLPFDGMGLFVHLEGASVVGQVSQSFERLIGDDTFVVGGATLVHHTQAVPVLNVQAGFSWVPWHGHSRLAIGYEFERWWMVGEAGDSHAELTTQGVFFRAEFGF